jgi:protein tyrosine/serine phosphatase
MPTSRRSSGLVVTAILALFLATAGSAIAQTSPSTNSDVKIKNFGQMDDRFFRGAQPKQDDYKQLAALGIKTIIDLTNDPKAYEKSSAEAVGIHYVNIPMSDKDYPPTAQIDQFLKLVDDPSTGKFFVHCAGGRHRTGVMGAVYRFNHDHWNYDRVYAEMKNYDFYTRFGHGNMKKFVEDYAVHFQDNNASATQTGSLKQATVKK